MSVDPIRITSRAETANDEKTRISQRGYSGKLLGELKQRQAAVDWTCCVAKCEYT